MILSTPQPTCIRPRTSQDTVRQRDVIWYRKDFGTDTGWREIRGVQVVGLQTEPHAGERLVLDVMACIEQSRR